MPKIQDSIEVQVPVRRAYNQWTQFEEFPKFMDSVQSVQQLDDTHVQWVAEIRGETREWTTEITEQQPDKTVAWKTIDGEVKNDGVVSFEQIAGGQTRVNVEMDVEGESTAENVAGDLLGVVKGQVRGDLERFKQLIETGEIAVSEIPGQDRPARAARDAQVNSDPAVAAIANERAPAHRARHVPPPADVARGGTVIDVSVGVVDIIEVRP